MFTSNQWTMTNFGPTRIEDLIDRPYISVASTGREHTNLSGFALHSMEKCITIDAQGHLLTVGVDHPVYLNDKLALPAHMIQEGNKIEIHPLFDKTWKGAGGTERIGAALGDIEYRFHREQTDLAQDFLIEEYEFDFFEDHSQVVVDCWRQPDNAEKMSFDFYKGFLRTAVLNNVQKDSVFYVPNEDMKLYAPQILRMLLHIGVFAYTAGDSIVLPSYSLRQLILTVGFGTQGADLLPHVENVTAPQSYSVEVDEVYKHGNAVRLYGTRGIHAGTVTEINGFLVATEGL